MSWRLPAFLLVGFAVGYGCSSEDGGSGLTTSTGSATTNSGPGGPGGTGGTGATASSNGGTGAMTSTGTSIGPGGNCMPGGTQCTDCMDNDNDGTIDAWDVECVGPLDNDEGSFSTGIPGDNSDPCKQDCFFDGNSGSGNDGCLWDLSCDPLNPGAPDCPYDPDKMNCPGEPSQQCLDFCGELVPNGCDCFGCCLITLPDATQVTILLGGTCDLDNAKDPAICKPCTQQMDCFNPCEPCEYCLGKTQLPPECGMQRDGGAGGGGQTECPGGAQKCSPDVQCPGGQYCQTGCCINIPA